MTFEMIGDISDEQNGSMLVVYRVNNMPQIMYFRGHFGKMFQFVSCLQRI